MQGSVTASNSSFGYAAKSIAQKTAQSKPSRVPSKRSIGKSISPERGRMGESDQLRLSQVLRQNPSLFDVSKISVVEKYVSIIDQLPDRFQAVETLFLSNNSIASLKGMAQFPNVRVLSIANNCLAGIDELEHLTQCPRLQILNLEFNPLTQMPNYRWHVIHTLPSLRLLDNKEVTSLERKNALAVIKKEDTVMNLMYSNEVLITKLQKGVMKLRLHDELGAVVFGRIRILNRATVPATFNFDTRKLLALWQFDDADEAEKRVMYNKLHRDVRKAYNLRNLQKVRSESSASAVTAVADTTDSKPRITKSATADAWDLAFAEVMLAQQTQIAQLLSSIEVEKQKAMETTERFMSLDPFNTIGQLREHEEQTSNAIQQERVATISNLRATVRVLMDELRATSRDPAQAGDYESKVHRLQQQLDLITEHSHEPRSTVTKVAATPALRPADAMPRGRRVSIGEDDTRTTTPVPTRGRSTSKQANRTLRVEDLSTPVPAYLSNRLPPQQQEPGNIGAADEESTRPQPSVSPSRRTATKLPSRIPRARSASVGAEGRKPLVDVTLQQQAAPPPPPPLPAIHRSTPQSYVPEASVQRARSSATTPLQVAQVVHGSPVRSSLRSVSPMKQGTREGVQDSEELQRQIELLQRDIEQHVATETMFQNINVQLRQRLEVFQSQNKENVLQAESELKRLLEEIASMRERMEGMSRRLNQTETDNESLRAELESARIESGSAIQQYLHNDAQVGRLQEELQRLAADNAQLQVIANQFHADQRRKEALHQIVEVHSDKAQLFHRGSLRKRIFRIWRQNTIASRAQRLAFEQTAAVQFAKQKQSAWRAWKRAYELSRRFENASFSRGMESLRTVFRRWRQFTISCASLAKNNAVAESHYQKSLQRRVLTGLRKVTKRYDMPVAEERAATANAVAFHQHFTKQSVWTALWTYVRVTTRRRKQYKELATHRAGVRLKKDTFSQWIDSFAKAQHAKARVGVAIQQYQKTVSGWTLSIWKDYVALRLQKLAREKQAAAQYRHLLLTRWVRAFAHKRLSAKQVSQASYLGARCVARYALSQWLKFMRHKRSKHNSMTRALRYSRLHQVRRIAQMVKAWRAVSSRHRLERAICLRNQVRLERIQKRQILGRWLLSLQKRMKSVLKLAHEQRHELQGALDTERGHVTDINMENLQLVDRLHALTSENAQLQAQISDQAREMVDMQRTLEESVLLETNIRSELEASRANEHALRSELLRLTTNVEDGTDDAVAARTHYNLDVQTHRNLITSLQSSLDEKQRSLIQAELTIENLNEQLRAVQTEADTKLAQAFEIAASLRELVDEREEALSAAASERIIHRNALADAQRRVMSDSAALVQTVDARDHQISGLQGTIARMGDPLAPHESTIPAAPVPVSSRNTVSSDEPTSSSGYRYSSNVPNRKSLLAEELDRQQLDAALSSKAVALKESELVQRASDFEQRKSVTGEAFTRTTLSESHASAATQSSGASGLQSEIELLRQRILQRLQSPRTKPQQRTNAIDSLPVRSSYLNFPTAPAVQTAVSRSNGYETQNQHLRSEIEEKLSRIPSMTTAHPR